VVYCWMLAGGCLVFVGLGLFGSVTMVVMVHWLCWFVVLHGGFHGGDDFGSFVAGFVVVLVVVFGGAAIGGWCCVLVRVNGGFHDGGGSGVDFCRAVCSG